MFKAVLCSEASLSILYLRCDLAAPAAVLAAVEPAPFNSLFEMREVLLTSALVAVEGAILSILYLRWPFWSAVYSSNVTAATFNSLFEMPFDCFALRIEAIIFFQFSI